MVKIDMRTIGLLILIMAFLAGCATPDRVVLLPGADGQTGAIVVKTARGEARLDKPYETVTIDKSGQIEAETLSQDNVQQQYGSLLAMLPPRPLSFTLYFIMGKDELTPESKPILELIKAELAKRPAPEITIIGHADKVGMDALNDVLSIRRAEAVLQAFRKAGISTEKIEIEGRGKREPIVQTSDGVAEPRNRRAEINIR
jgi:OmpA-OmpF porin, OOP family